VEPIQEIIIIHQTIIILLLQVTMAITIMCMVEVVNQVLNLIITPTRLMDPIQEILAAIQLVVMQVI
jgi:hypothetical protein